MFIRKELARLGHTLKTVWNGGSFQYGATESAPYQPFGPDFGLTIVPLYVKGSENSAMRGAVKDILSRRVAEVVPSDGRYQLPVLPVDSFLPLIERIERDEFIPKGWLNNVTVNMYEKGDFIRAHVDNLFVYDDIFAIVSLGAHCLMRFVHIQTGEELEVVIPDQSVYFLSGPARYVYFHMVLPCEGHRTSLVFRRSIARSDGTFRPVDSPIGHMMPYRATSMLNTLYAKQIGGVRVHVDDSFMAKEQLGAFDTAQWVRRLRPLQDWSLTSQLNEDALRIAELYENKFIENDFQWRIKALREYYAGIESSMIVK